MALSEFVAKECERLSNEMEKLAHSTMMGNSGVDAQVLIAMGKYRQSYSERQRWLARRKKIEEPETTMEEMPDEEEEREVARPAVRKTLSGGRPRMWGGT